MDKINQKETKENTTLQTVVKKIKKKQYDTGVHGVGKRDPHDCDYLWDTGLWGYPLPTSLSLVRTSISEVFLRQDIVLTPKVK